MSLCELEKLFKLKMLKMLYNLEKEQVKEIIKSPKIGEIFLPGGV